MNSLFKNTQTITVLVSSVILVGIFVISCSDKKKEEAAKLEAQMMQEQLAAESLNTARVADSIASESLAVQQATVEETYEKDDQFSSPRPKGEGYTVQVDGSSSQEYAEYVVGLYEKRGYEAYIATGTVQGETVYRVRVGNFESISQAQALVLELNDKYSIDPWIDKIEQ